MQTNALIELVRFRMSYRDMPQTVDAQYVKIRVIACLRALLDATLTYTVSYKI